MDTIDIDLYYRIRLSNIAQSYLFVLSHTMISGLKVSNNLGNGYVLSNQRSWWEKHFCEQSKHSALKEAVDQVKNQL